MPAAYLTTAEAQTRLAKYSIAEVPSEADLLIASDDLDLKRGFIGDKYVTDGTQHRQFPRGVTVQDDVAGAVPERILDWVALRAYQLMQDDEPGVTSERVDEISQSYSRPKRSQVDRWMKNLLRYYRARSARIV